MKSNTKQQQISVGRRLQGISSSVKQTVNTYINEKSKDRIHLDAATHSCTSYVGKKEKNSRNRNKIQLDTTTHAYLNCTDG